MGAHRKQMQRTYGPLLAALPKGSKVLDLGCGAGYLLRWLSLQPGIVPVGVDASPSQVAVAQRAVPEVDIYCEDGLAFLRGRPDTFSAIFCMDVLEHLEDEDQCLLWLQESARALRPGGFVVCRVPNAANITGVYTRYMDLTHKRSFTSTSLIQLIQAAGFIRCSVVPYRAGCLKGAVRLWAENLLHRVLFRICGQVHETVFTSTVCVAGRREPATMSPDAPEM